MANQQKESIVTKLIAFITDKKKLPLLLLLLGGGATVVTGTVLLANPGNGGNTTSQTSSGNSGNTTSQPGGSNIPFSGDDVPEWDFDNATLDGSGTAVGVGYDYNWNARFQNEYFYQVGRNLIEGAPETFSGSIERYTELLFSIYNMRSTEVEFLYHFEVSEARKTYMLESEEFDYTYTWMQIAYDQEDTILVLFDFEYQTTEASPLLGGSYTPIETYISTRFNPQENEYNRYTVLLQFDINDNSQYTILDGYEYENRSIYVSDILIDEGKLYLSAQVSKFTIDNRLTQTNTSKFSFIEIPETYPTFINYPQNIGNPQFSYLVEADISNYASIQFVSSTAITFDGNSNIWFYGYRKGFETKYFNENGEIALGLNGYIFAQNEAAITTHFTDLENNFLSVTEKDRLYPLIENKAKEFFNRTFEYQSNLNLSINFNLFGFYNFETGLMTKNNYATNTWQSVMIDNVQYQISNNFSSMTVIMSDDVTAFQIVTETSSMFPIQQNNYGWFGLNPEYRLYTYSSLSSVDLDTGELTLIEENDDNGKYISNIYQKVGGYYVTGTYYESETTPNVQSTDAFLLEVDENFETVAELVLAGSGDDMGSQITLNAQGRPVWLVQSSSTDGDFAEAGASNTEGQFKLYSVSF
jgi:hypothetical protein